MSRGLEAVASGRLELLSLFAPFLTAQRRTFSGHACVRIARIEQCCERKTQYSFRSIHDDLADLNHLTPPQAGGQAVAEKQTSFGRPDESPTEIDLGT